MRLRLPIVVLLLLLGGSALAQEEQAPDYSRETLFQMFVVEANRTPVREQVEVEFGSIDFTDINTRYRFFWLPFLTPIPYSYRRTNVEIPNPFVLTGTSFPQTAQTWRRGREMSRELRRIERMEKEKRARVRVDSR
ncbi:MAG TPA: hypothetical protein VNL91_09440 [Thermoanaerobaculia bacterium]|nr:hypothetical protein [Thermoanaerobaculia bacterium]